MPDRVAIASLVDEVSNRLQVVLGYAQILHELPESERLEAITAIEQECGALQATLRSLTGWARDEDGRGPWQQTAHPTHGEALRQTDGTPVQDARAG